MDPLSITASIIAIIQLTTKVAEYFRDVKDAPKDCQQYAQEASNLLSLLIRLLYHVEQATKDDPWYTGVRALNIENGPFDQYKQALEQLFSKVTIQDGLQKIQRRMVWRFNKGEVERILERLERLKGLVSIALKMDHFKLSQAIKRDVLEMQNAVSTVQDELATVRNIQDLQWDAQKLQQHQAVMQWLSSTDFATQQHDIISRKEEGTGQWFLDSAEFKAWQQGLEMTLFCPGIPGAGKTMMAAIAIDQLCKTAQTKDIGVAYAFCTYKDRLEQTATSLLAAVLKQLVQSRPDIAAPITQMYDNHQKHKTRPLINDILGALQLVCSAYPTTYIILDALDECTDQDGTRARLIDKLHELQGKSNVRLMFTSRFIPEIEDKFKSDPKLEVRASNHDVRRYVASQLPRLPKCIQRSSELMQDVQDQIAEAVDGMFLLARLHVDSLLDKKTIQKAKATLRSLRKGTQALDTAYEEAIERMENQLPEDTSLAKRALSWITYAQRPLATQELCHALAIEPGKGELDPEAVYDVEDILSVCAGLVTVDTESDVVRLVHYTTQEYLERIRLEWIPNAQVDIASACITYLSFDVFLSGSCDNDEMFESRLRDNPFLDYSARYWDVHTKPVQQVVSKLALVFLCCDPLVLTTVQVMLTSKYNRRGYSQQFRSQVNGLHLVALCGLNYFAETLLGEPEYSLRADSKDSVGQTPLSWAARIGHEAVVKLLVERDDIKADSKDIFGRTPLSWAALNGHEAVVKLLVERDDIKADSRDSFCQTPLSWAALNGYEAVVKLLVERDDIKVNSEDRFGQTPLSLATWNRHEAVVKLLKPFTAPAFEFTAPALNFG